MFSWLWSAGPGKRQTNDDLCAVGFTPHEAFAQEKGNTGQNQLHQFRTTVKDMEQRFPAQVNDERTMVCDFLDAHRAMFIEKVRGLTSEQLGRKVAASTMTLAGLIKHLALVEDSWFQDDFLGLGDPEPWASAPFDEDPDWEWHSAVNDDPDFLLDLYRIACDRSRAAVQSAPSLDVLAAKSDRRTGAPISLRWIMLHMIEETAQHNGHADLLREAIDTEGQ